MTKKKKVKKSEKKQEEPNPNSSPVCYASSKDLRPGYKDDQSPPQKE